MRRPAADALSACRRASGFNRPPSRVPALNHARRWRRRRSHWQPTSGNGLASIQARPRCRPELAMQSGLV